MSTDQLQMARQQFLQLNAEVYEKPLVYLDSAATCLKPVNVCEVMHKYNLGEVSNVHRGAHFFSSRGTTRYEEARQEVTEFIGAYGPEEIVFTKGTTESINLVACSLGAMGILQKGDVIFVTEMEHHSNFLPWQQLAHQHQCQLKTIALKEDGTLDLEQFQRDLSPQTKIVAFSAASNTLGTLNPIEEIVALCKTVNALTVVDGAQLVAHRPVEIKKLGCDFFAFSGHKIYGPFGVGVLYGKVELLRKMPPYQLGGGMIDKVTLAESTFLETPYRFEAGTPNVPAVLGLAEALKFVKSIGFETIMAHEKDLLSYATEKLLAIPGIKVFGPSLDKKMGIISIQIDDLHPSDAGAILDRQGVAVRTGHHCNLPLMRKMNILGTVRVSLAVYSTTSDIDRLVQAIDKVKGFF